MVFTSMNPLLHKLPYKNCYMQHCKKLLYLLFFRWQWRDQFFLKKDELLPIASRDNADLKEIFQICTGNVNENLICKKRPCRVGETTTFIINQNATKVVHPFDLETDDLGVKMTLTENVRFYEYEIIDDSSNVSHEVTVRKDEKGRVINGTYKERQGKVWCKLEAMPKKHYAVVRRRASFSDLCSFVNKICNIYNGFRWMQSTQEQPQR